MTESGSATPLLTLSITQLQTLLTKFAARNEAWESLVSSLSNRLKKLPKPSGLRVRALPLLTPRETELAWQMREDLTLDQIARERFVSRNTVKSQVRSLYVKLGVSSRQSAVQLLERGGFYERQPPRRN
ncbi:response regulator transcription factor [Microbacterium sp. RG1]|nr:response regulator transcription factor [Microbacterium sp. RG1]